ncbi:DUF1801 domain-containing protein [Brevundimonas sp.]|uniref:DUF1801 domain-containing protein n=1 Tax=Brevundimonas sp. TaxID=1871086 RepID=UPI003D12823A
MTEPVLLSGGNPQIAKGFGDAPVQAWLDAVPGWKQDVCRRLDALIVATVPGVLKAVKWNTPLYGVEEGRWFASMHCYTTYVRVTFFQGTRMAPAPAGPSKVGHVRYHDIREGQFDDVQLTDWMTQAAALPGEMM